MQGKTHLVWGVTGGLAVAIAAMERLHSSDLETLMVIADLFADAPPHAMEVTHVAV